MDQRRFEELWERCVGAGGEDVFRQIEVLYGEAHRHYHDQTHIVHCLRQFDLAGAIIPNPDAVEMALWFHDAIYEVPDGPSPDNERRSAELFLIAAAFAPTAALAVLFWQLRSFLGQMDVPARTSYIMAVVGPEERVAMAGIHIVGRSVSGIGGPSVATALWQAVSASAPLIGCAVLKIAYDITLYFMFRNVKPPEEAEKAASRAASRQS